jgi:hypothetical protein
VFDPDIRCEDELAYSSPFHSVTQYKVVDNKGLDIASSRGHAITHEWLGEARL